MSNKQEIITALEKAVVALQELIALLKDEKPGVIRTGQTIEDLWNE